MSAAVIETMQLSVGFVGVILCGLAAAQGQVEVGYSPDAICSSSLQLAAEGLDGECIRISFDSVDVGVIADCNFDRDGGTLTLYTNPGCDGDGNAKIFFENGGCLSYSANEVNASEDLGLEPTCLGDGVGGGGEGGGSGGGGNPASLN